MTVLARLNHARSQIGQIERHTEREISAHHRAMLDGALRSLNSVTGPMQQARDNGEPVTLTWLHSQDRLGKVRRAVYNQARLFGAFAQGSVTRGQAAAVSEGARASQQLLGAAINGVAGKYGVSVRFNHVPDTVLARFVAHASNGWPLERLFSGFGAEAQQAVTDTLYTAIATGAGPRQIAGQVAGDLNISLYRALTISRTEINEAYRGATLSNYQANSDVVSGWIWSAEKSAFTCAVCLAMDGSQHDLEETLDSHPNCRCAMLPITKSFDDILGQYGIDASDALDSGTLDPFVDETSVADTYYGTSDEARLSGAEWFDAQPDSVQQQILGSKAALNAYNSGDVTLADFIGRAESNEWGVSRYQRSLKDIAATLGLRRELLN